MADDFLRTLDDVVTGYQGMSSTIGSFSSVMATPAPPPTVSAMPVFTSAPPPPPIMSQPVPTPAQVSAQAMGYEPSHMPFVAPQAPPAMSYGGGYGGGGGMMGYGAAQAQIQSNYIQHPSYAAYMSAPGMMHYPDASMMTPSSMGAFRSAAVQDRRAIAPYGISGSAPPTALFPHRDMERTRPLSQFQRPMDAAITRADEQERLVMQNYESYARGAGRMAVGAFGAATLGTVGAGVGAYFGGIKGAEIGMTAGQLAGTAAAFIPGVSEAAGALMRPAIERNYDATRMQMTSRNFVVGGRDLDVTGSGLSTGAAFRMTQGMDGIAAKSGGGLSRKDLTNIMQAAGEHELLDMTQNTDEIVEAVGKISKVLGMFAQITGDPDFQNNIKKMGQLRRLGIGIDQMDSTMRNADQFARMAGMDFDQVLQRQGMQGAAIYNQMGISPGQGVRAGFHAAGTTSAAVNAGVWTEEQLAILGGKSGVEQRAMESMAATIAGPLQTIMAYYAKRGKDGRMGVDTDALGKLATGEVSFEEALQIGAQKANEGGERFITDMMSRRKEVMSQTASELGPEQTEYFMGNLVLQMQSMFGGPDKVGLDTVAGFLFGDQDMGNQFADQLQSQDYWNTRRKGLEAERRRRQFDLLNQEFDDGPSRRQLRRSGRQGGIAEWMSNQRERSREEAAGRHRVNLGGHRLSPELELQYGVFGDPGGAERDRFEGDRTYGQYGFDLRQDMAAYGRRHAWGGQAAARRSATDQWALGDYGLTFMSGAESMLFGDSVIGGSWRDAQQRRTERGERQRAFSEDMALQYMENIGTSPQDVSAGVRKVFEDIGVEYSDAKGERLASEFRKKLDDKYTSKWSAVKGVVGERYAPMSQEEMVDTAARVVGRAAAEKLTPEQLATIVQDAAMGHGKLEHILGTDVIKQVTGGMVADAKEGLLRRQAGITRQESRLEDAGYDLSKADDKAAIDLLMGFSKEDAELVVLFAASEEGTPISKKQALSQLNAKDASARRRVREALAENDLWTTATKQTLASKFNSASLHGLRGSSGRRIQERTHAAYDAAAELSKFTNEASLDSVLSRLLGDEYREGAGIPGLSADIKDKKISKENLGKIGALFGTGFIEDAMKGLTPDAASQQRIADAVAGMDPDIIDELDLVSRTDASVQETQDSIDRLDTSAQKFLDGATIFKDAAEAMYKRETGKDHPRSGARAVETEGNGETKAGPDQAPAREDVVRRGPRGYRSPRQMAADARRGE